MYIYIYIYIYIYVYIHMCMYVYIYIYIYTGDQKELLTCGADSDLVCGRWDHPLSVLAG